MINESLTVISPVPYSDTDASGYVHNARIVEYTERGRVSLFEANGVTIAEANAYGYTMATGRLSIIYHNPVCHGDVLVVATSIKHINSYRIKTEFSITRDISGAGGMRPEIAFGEATTLFLDANFSPKMLPDSVFNGEGWDAEKHRKEHDYEGTVGA